MKYLSLVTSYRCYDKILHLKVANPKKFRPSKRKTLGTKFHLHNSSLLAFKIANSIPSPASHKLYFARFSHLIGCLCHMIAFHMKALLGFDFTILFCLTSFFRDVSSFPPFQFNSETSPEREYEMSKIREHLISNSLTNVRFRKRSRRELINSSLFLQTIKSTYEVDLYRSFSTL